MEAFSYSPNLKMWQFSANQGQRTALISCLDYGRNVFSVSVSHVYSGVGYCIVYLIRVRHNLQIDRRKSAPHFYCIICYQEPVAQKQIIMKKLLLSVILCQFAILGYAQELFEGTLKARSYEYHSKSLVKFSKGMLQNGSRDVEMYVKGNKLGSWDALVNIQTIYDVEDETIYFVFHEIKKAVATPMDSYTQAVNSNTAIKPEPTDETKIINGLTCRKYTGTFKSKEHGASTEVRSDVWLCEDLKVHNDLAPYVSGNTGLPMVGMKYIVDSNTKAPMVNMNTYNAYDIKEIDRSPVSDDKFVVPQDYKVISASSYSDKSLLSVYSENEKVLKKNKKLSEKETDLIKFDIDEEWDF